jgi:glycosyltransferase involved in cell wall biosynthesis
MLDLFASARIYMGISLSDGISTSLLEAMAMGAFPIQTSTACVDDWFKPGETGFVISDVQTEVTSFVLSQALSATSIYTTDQAVNHEKIFESASSSRIRELVGTFYRLGSK